MEAWAWIRGLEIAMEAMIQMTSFMCQTQRTVRIPYRLKSKVFTSEWVISLSPALPRRMSIEWLVDRRVSKLVVWGCYFFSISWNHEQGIHDVLALSLKQSPWCYILAKHILSVGHILPERLIWEQQKWNWQHNNHSGSSFLQGGFI